VEDLPTSHNRNIHELFQTLTITAINVQELDVKIYDHEGKVPPYVESLQQLHTFKYALLNKSPTTISLSAFPRLRWSRFHLWTRLLRRCNATKLWVLSEQISNLKLRYSHWDNLRVMEVGASSMNWENISLPNVQRIIFTRESPRREPDASGSPLFIELANNPSISRHWGTCRCPPSRSGTSSSSC
jgi:hypothetical protein